MKKIFLMLMLISTVFFTTACSDKLEKELKTENVNEETLYLREDGSVQVAYVEDFGESYYNLDELKTYIGSELNSFNKSFRGESAAVLSEISETGKKVKAVLTFKSAGVYMSFNETKGDRPFKLMYASEAAGEYGSSNFYDASSEEMKTVKGNEVLGAGTGGVSVLEGPILLQSKAKIDYYTAGRLIDRQHLRLDEGETAVVVFSK